jgi:hypothetical protein
MSERKEDTRRVYVSANENRAGRVRFDARGKAVWDWDPSAAHDSTTCLIRRLDNEELRFADTQALRPPARKTTAPSGGERRGPLRLEDEPDPGGGFDPYNSAPGDRAGVRWRG